MRSMLRVAGGVLVVATAHAVAAPAGSGAPDWAGRQYAQADHAANRTVFCRSRESYNECPKEFPGPAVLIRQISKKPCTEGLTWGTKRRAIWVEDGCAGIFGERPEPGSEADAAADSPDGRPG